MREMKTIKQRDIPTRTKSKTDIPTVNKPVNQPEILVMQMQSGSATSESSTAISYKAEHTLTIRSSNSAPRYFPKRYEIMPTQRCRYIIAKIWKQIYIPIK